MKIPSISDLDISNKKVLLRLDLDCEPDIKDLRIRSSEETLNYLKTKNSEIIIIGHKGRPGGKVDNTLSLRPFQKIFNKWGAVVYENLRFDSCEEKNDSNFAQRLSVLGDIYVNEAFASSHRAHASIVGLPKLLPHAAGFRFVKEIENLSKVFENPKRPLIFVISGVKEDKLQYLKAFEQFADKILIGGRLPEYLGDKALESVRTQSGKVIIGNLIMDKEDITLNTIDIFKEEIARAGTIVLSGPIGRYEDLGHRQGTEEIFKAVIANKSAFKVAGGGDTEKAVISLGLDLNSFDWFSVGGGAMLEFLANKTLPGIESLRE